jgi:hypothetical protein
MIGWFFKVAAELGQERYQLSIIMLVGSTLEQCDATAD